MAANWNPVMARLEALLAACPGVNTVITDENCALNDNALIAVMVLLRAPASRAAQAWDMRSVTRTWSIIAYLSRVCSTSFADQRASEQVAVERLEVLPAYLAALEPRDFVTTTNPTGVQGIGDISDNGLFSTPWGSGQKPNVYYAVEYLVPITVEQ